MRSNKIYPCLWFDDQAGEAAEFYCSVFDKGRITAQTSLATTFELDGHKFMGINGGPMFQKNPSVSFFLSCQTKEKVSKLWNQLTEGGMILMPLDTYAWSEHYGWVQDRYGVNWQLMYGETAGIKYTFTPCLMFVQEQSGKARDAIELYTSVFGNSKVIALNEYTEADHDTTGFIKHGSFTLFGKPFVAMDSSGGHQFRFNEGISLVVECATQQEIDFYWDSLKGAQEEGECGWIKDRFGLWWQIIPDQFVRWATDAEKGPRVMEKAMSMKKLDLHALENA
jgi:predicted 3-demethylubiquinone-9 3-methyltransferase (glyoxalase superfamily)